MSSPTRRSTVGWLSINKGLKSLLFNSSDNYRLTEGDEDYFVFSTPLWHVPSVPRLTDTLGCDLPQSEVRSAISRETEVKRRYLLSILITCRRLNNVPNVLF